MRLWDIRARTGIFKSVSTMSPDGHPSPEEMAEHSRKRLEAAREELQHMSTEEFEEMFEELLERLEVFDESTDLMIVQFAVGIDEGIEKWRLQHLDNSIEGSLWDKQKYVLDFDEVGANGLGIDTFTVNFVQEGAPAPEDARKALYAAFREASEVDSPDDLFISDVQMRVDVTEDGFSISYL
ncbi:hypothetical protein [Halobacterium noricense]|uniref:hypothetical protein n=1 Tax=Halobacterium noricense TaxID=223182 RepID=UPI001E3C08F7|nr:hypothetical protein [Halobacterium noricense]UHH27270.1 hypothetical protein LT974_17665 [Halobacterium noricense]